MKLVQVGNVGRPHGYRGEFLLSTRAATGNLPEGVGTVYIGTSAQDATPFNILATTDMPKGLRLKLAGFDSDTVVKSHSNKGVFINREQLPATDDGEYYVEDLVGFEVLDEDRGNLLGVLSGVEAVAPGCPDRWWVRSESNEFAFPASESVIVKVDPLNRSIRIRHGNDFQQNL